MKFFTIKRAFNYCGFSFYNFFAKAPLWTIRPLINSYYGNCWTETQLKSSVLFIHIPKNAGSSVMEALYGKARGHHPASFYMANDEKRFRKSMSFAIIRNPFDRFCSVFYHYKKDYNLSQWEKYIGKSFFSHFSNPDELAKKINSNQRAMSFYKTLVHSLPQCNWLMVESSIVVRNLFAFEDLYKVEDFLRDALKNPRISLPHANSSKRLTEWQGELSPEAKHVVERIYKDDFRVWESIS